MLECPGCGRVFPEVAGAPTQVCPHCAHEFLSASGRGAEPAIAHADPVGALQQAWRIARRDHVRLLLIWLPALAVEIAITLLAGAYERAQGIPSDPFLMLPGERMRWLGVVLPLSILASALRLGLWAFIAAFVLDRATGGARLREWRRLVAPALAAGSVLTLAFIAGLFMLIVGFFVLLHWFLYVPAHLADGTRGVGAAFEASRRFARERRTHGFTALVVLVGGAALAAEYAASLAPGIVGTLAPVFVAWVLGPIVPMLAASYLAVSKQAPASSVAAASAPARETTKCPRCATLIAYASSESGSATEVTCPGCGYSGRVL